MGDVVQVQDSNVVRGRWRLAEVISANAGSGGVVRDVKLRYKNVPTGPKYSGCEDTVISRSVHRVVVLLPVEEQTMRK